MLRVSVVVAALAVALVGCGSDEDSDQPLISSETYYQLTRAGKLSTASDEELDNVGRALCDDLRILDSDNERRMAWILANEYYDTELQALGAVLAETARFCPEHFHLWDEEVRKINGGELPW